MYNYSLMPKICGFSLRIPQLPNTTYIDFRYSNVFSRLSRFIANHSTDHNIVLHRSSRYPLQELEFNYNYLLSISII